MLEIGIVGLDTSHGEAFAEVLAGADGRSGPAPTIAAVWDSGLVRDDAYVESVCETYGAIRYDDPAEMVGDVDAALVLSVDWERHVPLAGPFLETGIPTLVDKPIAGSTSALEALAAAAGETPLFGGSALPYHPSFADLRDGSETRTLHLAGYNDFFYYRAHVVDAARRIAGADWTAVEPVPATDSTAVEASFADGTWATLRFDGSPDEGVFGALDVADRTRAVIIDSSKDTLNEMYEPYLDRFLAVARGSMTAPTAEVLDAAGMLLAVEAAIAEGRAVTPGDDIFDGLKVQSASFLAGYEPYY